EYYGGDLHADVRMDVQSDCSCSLSLHDALPISLPADSGRRLDALVPALAKAAAATADPQATLARGVDLVEAIASRAAYLEIDEIDRKSTRLNSSHVDN